MRGANGGHGLGGPLDPPLSISRIRLFRFSVFGRVRVSVSLYIITANVLNTRSIARWQTNKIC
jgi:hypothetical protein